MLDSRGAPSGWKIRLFCDCPVGQKGKLCKHCVGLLYKIGQLEVTSEVRSQKLGQKRKRGRPKKIPHCLVRSPGPRVPIASASTSSPRSPIEVTVQGSDEEMDEFEEETTTVPTPTITISLPYPPQAT